MKLETRSIRPIHWDAHGCPPFTIDSDLSFLKRYKNSGLDLISLNIGFDLTTQNQALELIHYFQTWIQNNNDEFATVRNLEQLLQNQSSNKLSITFDIEGCNLLNGSIDMITSFYDLGVRQMGFAYNTNNSAGGGCLDVDNGLSDFGRQLIYKCNQTGMVIDCSHTGYRTSMEIIDLSQHPVIFSHSNAASLVKHPRNIIDDQIIACAKRGGVIGINGIGIFLGNNDTRTERIVEHIDYIVQLVGSEHVGIGLDCLFNENEINNFVKSNPETFPSKFDFDNVAIAEPEQFAEISDLLTSRGYAEKDINNILGESFFRVAKTVWK